MDWKNLKETLIRKTSNYQEINKKLNLFYASKVKLVEGMSIKTEENNK